MILSAQAPGAARGVGEAELTWVSYGLRIGLRVDDPEARDHLMTRLPPGQIVPPSPLVERSYSLRRIPAEDGAGEPGPWELCVDGQGLAREHDLETVADALGSDVQLFVAEMAQARVFVHAGAVGWQGQAIIVPGPSLSGKTTLVTALVRAGATYYSDEYAVLDAEGRVHPYPGPLSIRQPDGGRRRWPVEALGGRRGLGALPVGVVVVSEYRAGARWQPRRLSAGSGALAILENTVSARRQPEVALATLRKVVVNAEIWEGVRGEADAMVQSLLRKS
jgi:hypothetical protein